MKNISFFRITLIIFIIIFIYGFSIGLKITLNMKQNFHKIFFRSNNVRVKNITNNNFISKKFSNYNKINLEKKQILRFLTKTNYTTNLIILKINTTHIFHSLKFFVNKLNCLILKNYKYIIYALKVNQTVFYYDLCIFMKIQILSNIYNCYFGTCIKNLIIDYKYNIKEFNFIFNFIKILSVTYIFFSHYFNEYIINRQYLNKKNVFLINYYSTIYYINNIKKIRYFIKNLWYFINKKNYIFFQSQISKYLTVCCSIIFILLNDKNSKLINNIRYNSILSLIKERYIMSFDNHKKILVYYFEYKEKFLVKQSISSFIFYQLDTEYLKKYIYNIYNFRIIIDKYLNQNRKWIIFTNYRKLKKKF